jgi:hypothetical protein
LGLRAREDGMTPTPNPQKRAKRPPQPIARNSRPRRGSKPRRERKTTLAALKRKLDTLFSAYVKERDGRVCITSGQTCEPHQLNAGHFISRRIQSLRWDPKNCHSQSVADNHFRRGAPAEYAVAILDRYGEAELRRLLARKKIHKQWRRGELERLIAAIKESGAAFELAYYSENL